MVCEQCANSVRMVCEQCANSVSNVQIMCKCFVSREQIMCQWYVKLFILTLGLYFRCTVAYNSTGTKFTDGANSWQCTLCVTSLPLLVVGSLY